MGLGIVVVIHVCVVGGPWEAPIRLGGSLGKTREIINSPSKLGVMYGLVELDQHSLGACVPGLTT